MYYHVIFLYHIPYGFLRLLVKIKILDIDLHVGFGKSEFFLFQRWCFNMQKLKLSQNSLQFCLIYCIRIWISGQIRAHNFTVFFCLKLFRICTSKITNNFLHGIEFIFYWYQSKYDWIWKVSIYFLAIAQKTLFSLWAISRKILRYSERWSKVVQPK